MTSYILKVGNKHTEELEDYCKLKTIPIRDITNFPFDNMSLYMVNVSDEELSMMLLTIPVTAHAEMQ